MARRRQSTSSRCTLRPRYACVCRRNVTDRVTCCRFQEFGPATKMVTERLGQKLTHTFHDPGVDRQASLLDDSLRLFLVGCLIHFRAGNLAHAGIVACERLWSFSTRPGRSRPAGVGVLFQPKRLRLRLAVKQLDSDPTRYKLTRSSPKAPTPTASPSPRPTPSKTPFSFPVLLVQVRKKNLEITSAATKHPLRRRRVSGMFAARRITLVRFFVFYLSSFTAGVNRSGLVSNVGGTCEKRVVSA